MSRVVLVDTIFLFIDHHSLNSAGSRPNFSVEIDVVLVLLLSLFLFGAPKPLDTVTVEHLRIGIFLFPF